MSQGLKGKNTSGGDKANKTKYRDRDYVEGNQNS